jgi:beta-phosphoglucomutase-like phosphatase (HAD superfamily)
MKTFRAILFDFDGVLADSERLHFLTFQEILAEVQQPLTTDEYFSRYVHCDDAGFMRNICADRNLGWTTERQAKLTAEKGLRFRRKLTAEGAAILYPGVPELIRQVALGAILAIVSMARRDEIESVLSAANLPDCFSGIITADDCRNPKPHPEPYLHGLTLAKTAEEKKAKHGGRPQLTAADCLVVEDSSGGLKAGKAAGAFVIAVAHHVPADDLRAAGADLVLPKIGDLRSVLTVNPAEDGLTLQL